MTQEEIKKHVEFGLEIKKQGGLVPFFNFGVRLGFYSHIDEAIEPLEKLIEILKEYEDTENIKYYENQIKELKLNEGN